MNTVDLFAGCGGMSLGFAQAGFRSVLAVEVDPDAAATYRRNFPESSMWEGRIEDLSDEALLERTAGRSIHALLAGIPCQGFSLAGKRDPFDARNTLFQEVVRVARVIRPSFVVLENVKGIATMTSPRGRPVTTEIEEAFNAAGYPGMDFKVLEAAAFGVPQYRERAVFIANRHGMENPYPAPLLAPADHRPIESAISDLATVPRNAAFNHEWTRHSEDMVRRIAAVQPGKSLYPTYRDAWKRQRLGEPSMTIKENHGGTHIHPVLDRTISAREMARLQTFPDDFLFCGRMKRVMAQVGNAVPPLLARKVAEGIFNALKEVRP